MKRIYAVLLGLCVFFVSGSICIAGELKFEKSLDVLLWPNTYVLAGIEKGAEVCKSVDIDFSTGTASVGGETIPFPNDADFLEICGVNHILGSTYLEVLVDTECIDQLNADFSMKPWITFTFREKFTSVENVINVDTDLRGYTVNTGYTYSDGNINNLVVCPGENTPRNISKLVSKRPLPFVSWGEKIYRVFEPGTKVVARLRVYGNDNTIIDQKVYTF